MNFSKLKDWWWLATIAVGVIVFVATLPKRLDTVEAGVQTATEKAEEADEKAEKVDDDFRDYLKSQQEVAEALNKYVAQQQQQAPNQAYQRAPEPLSAIERYWDEQEQRYYCDDGQQLWWADSEGAC
jgi:hypothetical protein